MKKAWQWILPLPLLGFLPWGTPDRQQENTPFTWSDDGTYLQNLLSKRAETFGGHPDSLRLHDVQIIYSKIDRDTDQRPHFTHFQFNAAKDHWFAPASLVKLPTAIIALEKVARYNDFGIDKDTHMETGIAFSCQTGRDADTSSVSGFPSIAQDIRKVCLVSDNASYSRLFEWVGPCELNSRLWQLGYQHARIVRRFAPCNAAENRHTNPIFFWGQNGRLLMRKPTEYCGMELTAPIGPVWRGKWHEDPTGAIVEGPMDFSLKNFIPLQDLHQMMLALVFPESFTDVMQWQIEEEDRTFLLNAMGRLPRESQKPTFDPRKFRDGYAKYFFFPKEEDPMPNGLRIYSKVGQSYGYMSEVAYVVHPASGIEFMLSAVVYSNRNETMNDGKYEYEEVCRPFLGHLGRLVYEAESARPKKVFPQLKDW